MKIETIITAVVFLGVGFLAGYSYKTQRNAAVSVPGAGAAATAGAGGTASNASSGAPGSSSMPGLPEGHPPLDEAAVINGLKQEAARNPQDPQILLKLANYCYDKHLFPLAIEWYRKALALDPKNVNARTDLGTALFYSGHADQAVTEYRKTLQTDPNHEPAMFNMVVVNVEGTHNLPMAEQFWEKLHQRNPDYPGLEGLKSELDAARRGSPAPATAP